MVEGDGPQEVTWRLRTGQDVRGQRHPERVLNPAQQLGQLQAPDAQIVERAVERHGEPRGVGVDLGGKPPHQFEDAGGPLFACHRSGNSLWACESFA